MPRYLLHATVFVSIALTAAILFQNCSLSNSAYNQDKGENQDENVPSSKEKNPDKSLRASDTLEGSKITADPVPWPKGEVLLFFDQGDSSNGDFAILKKNTFEACRRWQETVNIRCAEQSKEDYQDTATPSKPLAIRVYICSSAATDPQFFCTVDAAFAYRGFPNQAALELINRVHEIEGVSVGKSEVFRFGVSQEKLRKISTFMHEFGHVLGLIHEHARGHRDDYLRLASPDSDPIEDINFSDRPASNFADGEAEPPSPLFDAESIMLYPTNAPWTNLGYNFQFKNKYFLDNKANIVSLTHLPLASLVGEVRLRPYPSHNDIRVLRRLYGAPTPTQANKNCILNDGTSGSQVRTLYHYEGVAVFDDEDSSCSAKDANGNSRVRFLFCNNGALVDADYNERKVTKYRTTCDGSCRVQNEDKSIQKIENRSQASFFEAPVAILKDCAKSEFTCIDGHWVNDVSNTYPAQDNWDRPLVFSSCRRDDTATDCNWSISEPMSGSIDRKPILSMNGIAPINPATLEKGKSWPVSVDCSSSDETKWPRLECSSDAAAIESQQFTFSPSNKIQYLASAHFSSSVTATQSIAVSCQFHSKANPSTQNSVQDPFNSDKYAFHFLLGSNPYNPDSSVTYKLGQAMFVCANSTVVFAGQNTINACNTSSQICTDGTSATNGCLICKDGKTTAEAKNCPVNYIPDSCSSSSQTKCIICTNGRAVTSVAYCSKGSATCSNGESTSYGCFVCNDKSTVPIETLGVNANQMMKCLGFSSKP